MVFKQLIKRILLGLNIPATQNLRYDIYTKKIMQMVLRRDSNGIDIGCHKGEILDEILYYAPEGRHYGFEPLKHLYDFLKIKYKGRDITLFQVALFDKKGITSFQYVVNAPSYSGLKKRKYDIPDAQISEIIVETDLLDHLVPETEKIDFIKIDVEGAEYAVLKGGIKTIQRCKPVIIFEYGLGAADYYGSKPEEVFAFLSQECGLKISTLAGFIKKKEPLGITDFCNLFNWQKEYYFIAFP